MKERRGLNQVAAGRLSTRPQRSAQVVTVEESSCAAGHVGAPKSARKTDAAELCPPGEGRERPLVPDEAGAVCVAPSS